MFEATDIEVRLGGKQILHSVDLSAEAGKVTCIVGPNGSGKSTLMKALTEDHKFHGQVKLNGKYISDYAPHEKAALRGVLPQSSQLTFPFTVEEVLRMGLSAGIHGMDDTLIERSLAQVGLQEHAHRTFHDLSGGEQQRAHLARVLCQVWEPLVNGVPRWLLLDEPVASLDIGHQLIVMRCVQDYAVRGGGVVAVMHDLNLTSMIADQVVMMSDGRIAARGSPSEVFTDTILSKVYDCGIRTNVTPEANYFLPQMVS